MAAERQKEYFTPREGIVREVIQADIGRYLGNDALVRPSTYQDRQANSIKAYRKLTPEMISDLREDSRRWASERKHLEQRYGYGQAPSYLSSSIHAERQELGPTLGPQSQSNTLGPQSQYCALGSSYNQYYGYYSGSMRILNSTDAPVVGQYGSPDLYRSNSQPQTQQGFGGETQEYPESATQYTSGSGGHYVPAEIPTGQDQPPTIDGSNSQPRREQLLRSQTYNTTQSTSFNSSQGATSNSTQSINPNTARSPSSASQRSATGEVRRGRRR